jgi:hypothetical protein
MNRDRSAKGISARGDLPQLREAINRVEQDQ